MPFRRYKRESHEGGISAPFILHWPGGIESAGVIRHQVAHLIDLMPTLVGVAGAEYPIQVEGHAIEPMQGISLVPFLDSDQTQPRTLFWEHEGNRAIRDGDWKLVGRRGEPWELYDVKSDRTELRDLVQRQPETFTRLRKKWDAWAREVGVLSPIEFDRRREAVRTGKPKRVTPAADQPN